MAAMKPFTSSLCTLLLLAASIPSARADAEDSWNLYAGLGTMHDSNLFRAPSRFASSDQITTAAAGLKINKPYAQQRFVFDGVLTDYRFRENDYLNYVGKNFAAAWLWSVTPQLHGNLSANYNEALNSFVDYRGRGRNLRTTESYRFDAEWELWGGFRPVGGVNHTVQKNSQLFIAEGDYNASAVEYGIKYITPAGNSLTAMGRKSSGEYTDRVINPVAMNDSGFEQTDVELRFVWTAFAKSNLRGRVGYVDRVHDNYSPRDYSGPVGSLDYAWDLGGKLKINAGFVQDFVSYQTLDSSYYLLRAGSIVPYWQIFGKTALRGRFSVESRDYRGAVIASLPKRDDMLYQSMVAVDWAPLRTLMVSTYLQRDTRSSSEQVYDFQSDMAGVSASLTF